MPYCGKSVGTKNMPCNNNPSVRPNAAGVTYEIVPGVTAANAAAASAGLPLTRRHTARRVQFITGADVTGELPQDLNWAALADPLALTAIYMGKRTFPALAEKLLA